MMCARWVGLAEWNSTIHAQNIASDRGSKERRAVRNLPRAQSPLWSRVRLAVDSAFVDWRLFAIALTGWMQVGVLTLALFLTGCATTRGTAERPGRRFEFSRDSFAYANELASDYRFDSTTGRTTSQRLKPRPEYTLHCFVMARAARQFFAHARFVPSAPRVSHLEYRRRLRAVMRRSARGGSPSETRVEIPGFGSLRDFSAAHAAMLKSECGGAWRSYFQRGHWRMVFPFTQRHQAATAAQLRQALQAPWPPLVHVVRFPALTINHAMLVFAFEDTPEATRFLAYDPNFPSAPVELRFDRATRRFSLPRNRYFGGGRVDVYEIFVDACH